MVIVFAAAAGLPILVIKAFGLGLKMLRLNRRGVAGPMFGKGRSGNFFPALDGIRESRHRAEQLEGVLRADVSEEFLAIMLLVAKDQRLVGRRRGGSQNFGSGAQ